MGLTFPEACSVLGTLPPPPSLNPHSSSVRSHHPCDECRRGGPEGKCLRSHSWGGPERDSNLCSTAGFCHIWHPLQGPVGRPTPQGRRGSWREVGAWAGPGPWSRARQEQWVLRDCGGPGWGPSWSQGPRGGPRSPCSLPFFQLLRRPGPGTLQAPQLPDPTDDRRRGRASPVQQ